MQVNQYVYNRTSSQLNNEEKIQTLIVDLTVAVFVGRFNQFCRIVFGHSLAVSESCQRICQLRLVNVSIAINVEYFKRRPQSLFGFERSLAQPSIAPGVALRFNSLEFAVIDTAVTCNSNSS